MILYIIWELLRKLLKFILIIWGAHGSNWFGSLVNPKGFLIFRTGNTVDVGIKLNQSNEALASLFRFLGYPKV